MFVLVSYCLALRLYSKLCVYCFGGHNCLRDVPSKVLVCVFNVVDQRCELWVVMILSTDSVSVVNSCSYIFWQEFVFVLYFFMMYVRLVCCEYNVG